MSKKVPVPVALFLMLLPPRSNGTKHPSQTVPYGQKANGYSQATPCPTIISSRGPHTINLQESRVVLAPLSPKDALPVTATEFTSDLVLMIRAHITLTTKTKFTSNIDIAFLIDLSALADALNALLVTFPWGAAVDAFNRACMMSISYDSLLWTWDHGYQWATYQACFSPTARNNVDECYFHTRPCTTKSPQTCHSHRTP